MNQPTASKAQEFASLGRPENLPDEIAHQIRQRILGGTFQPGERLATEYELAQTFAVSRNVVREAIARLKLSGYVETRRGTGTFVSHDVGLRNFEILPVDLLQINALEQVYQLRVEIESGAAALAARCRTASQLEAIRLALERVDEAGQDWRRGTDTALDFHYAVGQATNNPYFIRLMAHMSHAIRGAVSTLRYTSTGTERIAEVSQEHHAIFDAIAAGDSDAARNAMYRHLSNGMRRHKIVLKGETDDANSSRPDHRPGDRGKAG